MERGGEGDDNDNLKNWKKEWKRTEMKARGESQSRKKKITESTKKEKGGT